MNTDILTVLRRWLKLTPAHRLELAPQLREGYRAHDAETFAENPYPADSPEADAWMVGWDRRHEENS